MRESPYAIFDGAKVLITGGVGFIGSTLALKLVSLGAKITIVDSLIPEYGSNPYNIEEIKKNDCVRLNITDVRDRHAMRYLIQGQDFLFNLAGQTSHMDSMSDPFTDLEINAKSQLSILETCRLYNRKIRIVFASTRQLYGRPHYLPVDEKHPTNPADVNGINKLAGEWYHRLYNNVYNIPTTVLRLTNTYGPRMRIKDARQTFIGVWIRMILEDREFDVWGGEQLRDFTYVDDCVDAFLLAASLPQAQGKVYNLGGEKPISLHDLAQRLVQANNGSGTFTIMEFPGDRKKIDIGDYYSDDTMIRTELGWKPQIFLTEGLQRTLAWYRTRLSLYIGNEEMI